MAFTCYHSNTVAVDPLTHGGNTLRCLTCEHEFTNDTRETQRQDVQSMQEVFITQLARGIAAQMVRGR